LKRREFITWPRGRSRRARSRHQALDLGRRQVEKSTTRSISTADFLSHVDQLG
jgi:hypothetical protein